MSVTQVRIDQDPHHSHGCCVTREAGVFMLSEVFPLGVLPQAQESQTMKVHALLDWKEIGHKLKGLYRREVTHGEQLYLLRFPGNGLQPDSNVPLKANDYLQRVSTHPGPGFRLGGSVHSHFSVLSDSGNETMLLSPTSFLTNNSRGSSLFLYSSSCG